MREIVLGSGHISGMSDPRGGSDSDRDSITGWTLVDREETPEPHDPQQDEEGAGIAGAGGVEDLEEESEQEEEDDESGCGMEEDEGDGGELHEELLQMGQHVQEVKGDADVESLASTTDISVLDEDKEIKDTAAMTGLKDDETDLSLASSPSLPEDLPAIKTISRKERKMELARGEIEPSSPSVVARLMEPFLPRSHTRDWLMSWLPLKWLMQEAQPEEQKELSEAEEEEALVAQLISQGSDQEKEEEKQQEETQQEETQQEETQQEEEGTGGFQALRSQVLNVWPLSILKQKEKEKGEEEGKEEGEMHEEEAVSNETASFSGAWLYDRALKSCSTLEQSYSVIENKFTELNPWGPDKQYQHTPSAEFNGRLNTIVMLTIATVLGLAIGHFLGWSSRSLWQDSLNTAQVRKLRELQDNLVTCMDHGQDFPFSPPMSSPIKPSISDTERSIHSSSSAQPHFSNPTPTFKETFEPEPMIHIAADLRDVLGYESLVESIVPPLEDAGVVVGSNIRRLETNHYYKPHQYENKILHRSSSADKRREENNFIRDDNHDGMDEWKGIDYELPFLHDSKLDLDHLDSDPIFPKPNIEQNWLTEPVFEDSINYINTKIKTASEITFDSEDLFIAKVSKETKQPELINHPKNSPIVDFMSKTDLTKKHNTISQSKSIPSVSDLLPDNDYEDDYILMPLETNRYVNKYEELSESNYEQHIILPNTLEPEEFIDDITKAETLSHYDNIPCTVDTLPISSIHYYTGYDDDFSKVQVFPDDDLHDDTQWLDSGDSSSYSNMRNTENHISLSPDIEELKLDLSLDLAAEMPAFVDLADNQIIEALAEENQELSAEMTRLQQLNIEPIKIGGKSAKESRILRERISQLINENEELRVAVSRMQFNKDPSGDKATFTTLSKENNQKRVAVSKLTHLVPDLKSLKDSANMLQVENEELRLNVGKLRYEQPMPRELNALTRELDNLKQTVREAEANKETPENLAQAKTYASYMTEVLAALNTLSEFGEGSIVEQMDVAADFFEEIIPVGTKIAPAVKRKIEAARAKFGQLRTRLGNKWEQIKTLSKSDNIKAVGADTLGKMNRVVVNVVNKMKEIGHATLMKKGKATAEKTVAAMADGFAALDQQFDKTWKMLQAEIKEPVQYEKEMTEVPIKPMKIEEEETVTTEVIEESGEEVEVVSAGDLIRDEPIDTPVQTLQLEEKEQENELDAKIKKSKEIKDQKRKEKEDKKLEKEKKKKEREADKQKKKEGKKESKDKKGQEKKERKDKKEGKDKNDKGKQNKKDKEEKNKHTKEKVQDTKINIDMDEKPYYKGQYNKNEKKQKIVDDDDEDDEDDDDDDKKKKLKHVDDSKNIRKRNDDDDDDRRDKESKMKQRWSKPTKYNMRQENTAANSRFIRRKGKNGTHESQYREGRDDWEGKRGKGREESRKRERKSEWQFDRARDRRDQREHEKKAEWYFDRAQGRNVNRDTRGGNVDGYGHNKHENQGTRRRYVRFSDDDDDDSDDDRKSKHIGGRHKKKSRREWVMPNFEYTGNAYHR